MSILVLSAWEIFFGLECREVSCVFENIDSLRSLLLHDGPTNEDSIDMYSILGAITVPLSRTGLAKTL